MRASWCRELCADVPNGEGWCELSGSWPPRLHRLPAYPTPGPSSAETTALRANWQKTMVHNKYRRDIGFNLRRGETMDKMLLIIRGIFSSVRQRLRLSLPPLEIPESSGLWIHASLKTKREASCNTWNPHTLELVSQQTFTLFNPHSVLLAVKPFTKTEQKKAYSVPPWIQLLFKHWICEWSTRCANWTITQWQNRWKMGVVQE